MADDFRRPLTEIKIEYNMNEVNYEMADDSNIGGDPDLEDCQPKHHSILSQRTSTTYRSTNRTSQAMDDKTFSDYSDDSMADPDYIPCPGNLAQPLDYNSSSSEELNKPPPNDNSNTNNSYRGWGGTDDVVLKRMGRPRTSTKPKPAKQKKSRVWEFYDKDEENDCVSCNLCDVKYKNFGNTSNLITHLKRKHPIQFLQPEGVNSDSTSSHLEQYFPTSSQSNNKIKIEVGSEDSLVKKKLKLELPSSSSASVSQSTEHHKSIDDSLVDMIILDCEPLSIVDKPGFKLFTRTLCPQYTPPTQKALFEEILPEKYSMECIATQEMLDSVDHVAISSDMWTSNSNINYLTITVHFIFDFKVNSIVLSTTEFENQHTSMNITNKMQEVLNTWKIADKVVTIVTENAVNITKAIVEYLRKQNHYCVAHVVNMAAEDCIKSNSEFSELLNKCRNVVYYFKTNEVGNHKLKELQKHMGQSQSKLKEDDPTEWNSALVMMQRLMDNRLPLSNTFGLLELPQQGLDKEQWDFMGDCINLLQPLEKMMKELSGQVYATLSRVIPLVRGLQSAIKNKKLSTQTGYCLQVKLLDIFERRLGDLEINNIVAKSCFLDPRFKKMGFGFESNADNAMQLVINEMIQMTTISKNNEVDGSDPLYLPSYSEDVDSDDELWENFNKKVTKGVGSVPSVSALAVKQYLDLPLLDRRKNPLDFWKQHEKVFPELSKLALKYLCIPATASPPKGQSTSQNRKRLDPQILDEILFLNSRLRDKHDQTIPK